jgi:hypothetical protein
MTRLPWVSFALAVVIGAGVTLHAQEAQQSPPTGQSTDKSRSPDVARPLIQPGDRSCLRETGSRIPPKPGHCLPVNGRSYSQEDLRRTGATRTADALRMLDPAIH